MTSKKALLLAGLPIAALAFATSPALAQEAASTETQASESDEILVTAQRRSQSKQDVGISIAAFAGEELRALNVWSGVQN